MRKIFRIDLLTLSVLLLLVSCTVLSPSSHVNVFIGTGGHGHTFGSNGALRNGIAEPRYQNGRMECLFRLS